MLAIIKIWHLTGCHFVWKFLNENLFLRKILIHDIFWAKEFMNFIDWVLLCHSFNLFSFDNTLLLSEDFSNKNLFLRKHFGIFEQNFINWVLLLHWDLIFVFFNTVIWEFFKWEFILKNKFLIHRENHCAYENSELEFFNRT